MPVSGRKRVLYWLLAAGLSGALWAVVWTVVGVTFGALVLGVPYPL